MDQRGEGVVKGEVAAVVGDRCEAPEDKANLEDFVGVGQEWFAGEGRDLVEEQLKKEAKGQDDPVPGRES
jgi:hypothetical protein